MDIVLKKYGVTSFENVIYEYNPIKLDWWGVEEEIIFEVQVSKNDNGYEVSVYFLFENEDEYERVVVFIVQTDETFKKVIGANLVARVVKDNILEDVEGLQFIEEQEAYLIPDMDTSKVILERILSQLTDTNPTIAENSLDLDDEEDEGIFYELLAIYAGENETFDIAKYEALLRAQYEEAGEEFMKYLKMEVAVIEENKLWDAFLKETPFADILKLTKEDLQKIAYLINDI
ncbi:hypothetical protein [Aureivirga sp. CE67]|uniref:hypothetical protein n=1 Tax=Aureivirga sp. CE67 TaxID=1788983 RepID=UPI0018CAFA77|nr:hypothetical protein [Aureivirga sp. CE67]